MRPLVFSFLLSCGAVSSLFSDTFTIEESYTQTGNLIVNALNATPPNWNELVVVNGGVSLSGTVTLNCLPGASFSNNQTIVAVDNTNGSGITYGPLTLTSVNLPPNIMASLIKNPDQLLIEFDIIPPAPPQNLKGKQSKQCPNARRTNHLSWQPSPTPGVSSYLVFRNGVQIATVPASGRLVYNDPNQKPLVSVTYKVEAVLEGVSGAPATVVVRAHC